MQDQYQVINIYDWWESSISSTASKINNYALKAHSTEQQHLRDLPYSDKLSY